MKKKNRFVANPYATNRGGKITAPKPVTSDPSSTVTKGEDLRSR